jgi:2-hydroxy-3-oxopropionate reductase
VVDCIEVGYSKAFKVPLVFSAQSVPLSLKAILGSEILSRGISLRMVGFIGLGVMGKPMAKNLVKAGYPLTVYDIREQSVRELVKSGAAAASSVNEVARRSDVVITMLPGPSEVEKVVLGDNGVLDGAMEGSIIVDMTASTPSLARRISQEADKKHVETLDAPVSGGEGAAIEGTLAIMVGGKRLVFHECEGIFAAMGKNVVYVGDSGAGHTTKLANQIIVAINLAAVSEALIFAKKVGVSPDLVCEAMKHGLGGSAVLDVKGPRILRGNFAGGGKLKYHMEQLSYVLEESSKLGVPLIMTALVQQAIVELCGQGKGDLDHSVIANFFERLANVEIKK